MRANYDMQKPGSHAQDFSKLPALNVRKGGGDAPISSVRASHLNFGRYLRHHRS